MGDHLNDHIAAIREYVLRDWKQMLRPAGGTMDYPFLTPGSEQYPDVLWDWDAWSSNVALRQILAEVGTQEARDLARPHERGCVLNFLDFCNLHGEIPGAVKRDKPKDPEEPTGSWLTRNNHKPCLAQHAAFLAKVDGDDVEWLRGKQQYFHYFFNNYHSHRRHRPTGLYFWVTTGNVGCDDDPNTFYRPHNSDASIYLNCFMVKEIEALIYLSQTLGLDEVAQTYRRHLAELKAAILEHCWDEWTGFFYSVDIGLEPVTHDTWKHRGWVREYDCLIHRILYWSGFLALWAGVATPEQARRVVEEHYRCKRTFNAPFGVRTLAKVEKMYNIRISGNPSTWRGPIWGMSNWMVFRGLVRYGFDDDARDLAEKTITLFGRDLQANGAMHEYYQPENGMGMLNPGFQNWNMLVLNMIAWLKGGQPVWEF